MLINDSCFHQKKKKWGYIQHMRNEVKINGLGWILPVNPIREVVPWSVLTGDLCRTGSSLSRAAAACAWVRVSHQVRCPRSPVDHTSLSRPIPSPVQALGSPERYFVMVVSEHMCPPVHDTCGSWRMLSASHELGLSQCELSKLLTFLLSEPKWKAGKGCLIFFVCLFKFWCLSWN